VASVYRAALSQAFGIAKAHDIGAEAAGVRQ
jgi:hypothetical protein